MKWINHNHLYYFWMVAREGSVARASEELSLSQPTISSQIKDLERSLGRQLFERAGRGLALTHDGRIAFNYANEIFSLTQQMLNALEHRPDSPFLKLAIGVLDAIPKPVVLQLLEPLASLPRPVRLVCREDKADRLLADLAARRTDIVLSDSPIGSGMPLQGFNHLLAESDVSFFADRKLAARLRPKFPRSLDGAKFLLPTDHTGLRQSLNQWFDHKRIHPLVTGEFDDAATMFAFGEVGGVVLPAPAMVAESLQAEYGLALVGTTREVRERLYAISREEQITHPGVLAIAERARAN
jgi:LysR family transcriptional activator of nhaA